MSADRVFDVIQSEAELLLTQPLMGRSRPELGKGVRSWPTSTSYILFYLVTGDGITVLRVLHHARDAVTLGFRRHQTAGHAAADSAPQTHRRFSISATGWAMGGSSGQEQVPTGQTSIHD